MVDNRNLKMELHFEYYAVKFFHQPYYNIDPYVCVPHSWIEINECVPKSRKFAVAYPAEPLPKTNKYVKKKTSPHREWKRYYAALIFGADNIEAAQIYITMKNSEQNQQSCNKENNGFTSVPRTIKQQLSPDISENISVMERSTVIVSTKSLKKTNDLKHNLEDHCKKPLITEYNGIKKNTEISLHPVRKTATRTNKTTNRNLPKEFKKCERNSKATLKYHKDSHNVIELIPGSRVYINKYRLMRCIKRNQNYNELAQGLMLEIFRLKALRVCALVDMNCIEGFRPGLDEDAKSAILQYVEQRGRAEGWGSIDIIDVLYSLRNKLDQLHA